MSMWNELTLGQYISLLDIEQNQGLDIVEKQQKKLAIIENKDEEEYDYIKYRLLVQMYHEKLAFLNELPQAPVCDYIETKTRRYKFCFELNEITSGQYIDINTFSNNFINMNKIAACFFLPMEGDKYMPYGMIPHDKVAEDLLDAKFIEVYGCLVFFCRLLKELVNDTIISSTITEQAKQTLIRLWQDGDGFIIQNK
jgi:hypothetical protein